MTENEREGHPQDPAEGADPDEQQQNAEQQNEERELNDGDDVTQPGGDEPAD
jgi:hypothetical protein